MKIFLIHGAGASPLTWRTLAGKTRHETECFSYDATHSWSSIIERCSRQVAAAEPSVVVGHSFGGVIAWHMAQRHGFVRGGISICSPWGGSVYADTLEMLTLGALPTRFFSNVGRSSTHMIEPRKNPSRVPWLNVVGTKGVINHSIPNDGVLTVRSQESLFQDENVLRVELNESHTESVHSDTLIELVDWFVDRS